MLPLALFALLCVVGVVLLVRQVIVPWIRFLLLRRGGVRLAAEVVDNDAQPLGSGKGAVLRPVVRYQVDGVRHVGTLENLVSNRTMELGRAIDILVDPARPNEPWAADEGTPPLGAYWYPIMVLIGIAGVWVSVARIR